jgi:hypothetical protein
MAFHIKKRKLACRTLYDNTRRFGVKLRLHVQGNEAIKLSLSTCGVFFIFALGP